MSDGADIAPSQAKGGPVSDETLRLARGFAADRMRRAVETGHWLEAIGFAESLISASLRLELRDRGVEVGGKAGLAELIDRATSGNLELQAWKQRLHAWRDGRNKVIHRAAIPAEAVDACNPGKSFMDGAKLVAVEGEELALLFHAAIRPSS